MGIDHSAFKFCTTMFDKHVALAPDNAHKKTCFTRSAQSIPAKFDKIAVQKLRSCTFSLRACKPTGVTKTKFTL